MLALLVRLVYNLTVANGYYPEYDAYLYNALAQHLLASHCYCLYGSLPNYSRPPLWPFVLALVYAVTGANPLYGRLFYCVLGSCTCVLIYLFARDLFQRRIALLVGLLAALYCGLFLYDGWLYTESLYIFLLTFFAWALYHVQIALSTSGQYAAERGPRGFWHRHRWALLSGIILGLITLTRPNGAGFFVVLLIWGIFLVCRYALAWWLVAKNLLLIAALAALLILPWTYRNYQVTHSFVLVSMGLGEVLNGAYNNVVISGKPATRGFWSPPPHSLNHDSATYTLADDAADTHRALAWIGSHVNAMPYVLALHFINMWKPYTYSHGLPMEEFPTRRSSQVLWFLIPLMSWPVFVCAAIGLLVTWRRKWSELFVIYLVLAFTIGENLVFYGDMRFRAPLEPMLLLLTGGLLWWLGRVWPTWQKRLCGRELFRSSRPHSPA